MTEVEMTQVQRVALETWDDFKRDLVPELFGRQPFQSGRYLFRGCGRAGYGLEPSFDRRFSFLPPDRRVALWGSVLRAFRSACREHGVDPVVVADDTTLIAFGQHYGLPTRLLDWSLSPYVAAFFAFRSALNGHDEAEQVAIWVLDTRSSAWSSEMGVEVVAPVAFSNQRLRNQSGRFTYAKTPHATLEAYIAHLDVVGHPLRQFTLPRSEAARALPDLDAMGANAVNLFPDWEGLAEGIALRLQLEAMLDGADARS